MIPNPPSFPISTRSGNAISLSKRPINFKKVLTSQLSFLHIVIFANLVCTKASILVTSLISKFSMIYIFVLYYVEGRYLNILQK